MQIARMYLVGMLSIPQIATETGMNKSAVRRSLLDAGVRLRTRSQGCQLRADHQSRLRKGVRRGPLSEKTKAAISRRRRLWAEQNAKGIRVNSGGYLEYTRGPNKGRLVHIVLWETHHGRRVPKGCVVHHHNEIKTNNGIENLEMMTRAAHTALHRWRNRKWQAA